MVVDRFSFEDNIKCINCGEQVNYGDDYECHLRIAHNISKNFPYYMKKALEEKKFRKGTRKAPTVETVDIEDDKKVKGIEENEDEIKEKLQLDKVAEAVEQSLAKNLADIVDMCEGKITLDFEEEEFNDGIDYEAELWKAFDDLENLNKETKVPEMLTKKILSGLKLTPNKQVTQKNKETMIKKEIMLTPNKSEQKHWYNQGIFFICKSYIFSKGEECGKRFNGRTVFRGHLTTEHGVKLGSNNKELRTFASSYDDMSTYECKICGYKICHDQADIETHLQQKHGITMDQYGEKHEHSDSNKLLGPQTKIPTKIVSQAVSRTGLQTTSSKSQFPSSKSSTPTDKSQTPSSKSQTPSSKTQSLRWWCPRAGCSFVTDKAGMLNKVGAEHVKEVHGATVEMMRANVTMWKFRKEKRSK